MTFCADVLGELRRGDADTATGRVHEHGLALAKPAHRDDEHVGREVVDGQRRALGRRHAAGTREHLALGHADDVRVAAESRHREHIASHPAGIHALADGIHAPADLVADDDRDARQVRVHPHASHDVGEIDTRRLDANAQLTRLRLRVRRFLHLQDLGGPGFRDPYLSHGGSVPDAPG